MTFTAVSDGTLLRYSLRRGGDHVVVLVHGWKQSHRLFDRVTNALAHDMTVLSYDQRGMGESDKPDSGYEFPIMARNLLELLEQFDLQQALLVGWSMGCTTVLEAARTDPSRIAKVMLVNGPLRLTKTQDFPFALTEDELAHYIEGLASSWPLGELAFYEASLLPEHERLAWLLHHVGMQTPLDVAVKLVRSQNRIDHRATVRDLDVPILAAYSSRDPYWSPGLAEWIATNARAGSAHFFENSAHCPPLEESEKFCAVIRNFHG